MMELRNFMPQDPATKKKKKKKPQIARGRILASHCFVT